MREIPSEWNGKPTKYKFFDGFMQAGILGKIFYVLTAPGLVIPLMMEGYRYNVQTRNGEKAAEFIAAQEDELIHRHTQNALTELNPAETNTKFQDAERARAAAAAQLQRG